MSANCNFFCHLQNILANCNFFWHLLKFSANCIFFVICRIRQIVIFFCHLPNFSVNCISFFSFAEFFGKLYFFCCHLPIIWQIVTFFFICQSLRNFFFCCHLPKICILLYYKCVFYHSFSKSIFLSIFLVYY